MSEIKIVLANHSRLLREMLNRVLLKADNLDVVQEITDPDNLPRVIEEDDVSWVIVSLPPDSQMPDWIDSYIIEHPTVRFMALANDGSWVKTLWLESREEDLQDLTLDQFIDILDLNSEPA